MPAQNCRSVRRSGRTSGSVSVSMPSSDDLPTITRAATRHDEPAVLAVDAVASGGDEERRRLLREAIEAGECIVYDRDGHVLGFAVLKRGRFYGRDFIDLVFVAPDAT